MSFWFSNYLLLVSPFGTSRHFYMIQLFRKMRQGLLAKNKFLQYFIYAFGEIVLVIAGILIALAINNQSELNKKDDQIASVMKQIRQDLLKDIASATNHIEFYHKKDSLITLVLFDQVVRDDYEKPGNSPIFQITTTIIEFLTNDNGYESLVRNIDNLPPRYEPLIANLNQIFVNDKLMVERFNRNISEVNSDILKDWEVNFEWYSKLMTGVRTPEVIEYYLNDPFYKNHVASYSIMAIQNHLPIIERYRVDAIKSYLAITELLELKHDEKNTADFIIPTAKLEELTGNYGAKNGFNVTVSLEKNGQLKTQASGQPAFILYPLSPTRFSAVGISLMLEFSFDDSGQASKMTIYQGGGSAEFDKN